MSFGDAIGEGFFNYANFSGRATRSEFWWWVLFAFVVSLVTSVIDLALFWGWTVGPLNTVTGIALFLPGLAVSVRRLHDTNRSGWWILITLTIVGIILLIVWYIFPSDKGNNHYGPNRYAGTEHET